MKTPMHIVLFEPDIPFNTGNVGRTCLAAGAQLHLVGRLGFQIDDAQVKRAGLDYWPRVPLQRHADWDAFLRQLPPEAALYFFSKKASADYWNARYSPGGYLVFGCETKGLPPWLLERHAHQTYRIPMQPDSVRSLNLSVSVGIVLYEALRQAAAVRA